MKIEIKYTYSPTLVRTLFVEQARRVTEQTVVLEESELSPGARQSLLDAVGYLQSYGDSSPKFECNGATARLQPLAEFRAVDLADPLPVESESTKDVARVDAERFLRELVARAPTLRAEWAAELERRASAKAEKARLDAETRQRRVDEIRQRGIDALLARDKAGRWTSLYYPHSSELNQIEREALGADCCEVSEAEAKRRNEEEDAARRLEEATWIAAHAPELAARHTEGLLPEAELLAAVREHEFGLLQLDRYQKITAADLWHSDDCYEARPDFDVHTAEVKLTAKEYETLCALRAAAPKDATVEVREHSGFCNGCNGEEWNEHDIVRRSALVTVQRLGRKLSREYAL
jgi:hypothetical protein